MKIRENKSLGGFIDEWKQLAHRYNLPWKDSFIKWELPPLVNADFAVVIALQLASKLKKSPYELALKLGKELSSACSFEVTVTEEGYLNCHIKDCFYKSYLEAVASRQLAGSNYQQNEQQPSVNIEFVSVNPTGYLHLGHLRNAVIGDTLAKVYRFLGYQVTCEYYLNDRGKQVDELIRSVLYYYDQLAGNSSDFLEENLSYRGSATKDAALWLLANSAVPIDAHNEKNNSTRKEVISFFSEKIKTDLLLCGVEFDSWFSEKEMLSKHEKLNSLLETFRKKDLVYYENNALFLRTGGSGDEKDRVLIKSDGELTYFLSDILYHLDKMGRADLLINIWGSDHHGYVQRLRSALRTLGYNEKERFTVILIQMVSLLENEKKKKFSKRAGTAIEVEETLAIIGRDQLRFCLLEKEVGHPISINPFLLKEEEEKSRLYYLQYAHARCHQLITRAAKSNLYDDDPFAGVSFLLKTEREKRILKNLIRFENILRLVVTEKKPSIIIQYLQGLARDFQAYYQSQQIIDHLQHKLTKQRLSLIRAIRKVLSDGLHFCGVAAPSSMRNIKD